MRNLLFLLLYMFSAFDAHYSNVIIILLQCGMFCVAFVLARDTQTLLLSR